jgi:hypothetical protein
MQFNTSGLNRMETTTQKKKQCFRPGWKASSNAINRQSNASGLDGMQAPTPSADKAMLQAWMERRLKPKRKSNASDGIEAPTQAEKGQ